MDVNYVVMGDVDMRARAGMSIYAILKCRHLKENTLYEQTPTTAYTYAMS